jgi:hypothetical protein
VNSGDQRLVGSGPGSGELVARYEELRARILGGDVPGGLGLALLMRRGVAAWIEGWSTVPALPRCPPAGAAVPPLPGALLGEVVLVLAGMALGTTCSEVHP